MTPAVSTIRATTLPLSVPCAVAWTLTQASSPCTNCVSSRTGAGLPELKAWLFGGHAVFGLPEVKVGVFPAQVLSVLGSLLPRRVLAEMTGFVRNPAVQP